MKNYKNFLVETKQEKTAIATYGRMNPPTIGHVKLAKKILSEARRHKAEPYICLSPTQNAKKDPLDPERKLFYVEKTIGPHIHIDIKVSLFEALSDLYSKGFKKLVFVVGSDRLSKFSKWISQYNGVEGKSHGFYDFTDIDFVSSGDRDPDAEGAAGMSASKVREFAVSGDIDSFKMGTKLSVKDTKSMYNEIRKAMKIETIVVEDAKMGKQSDDNLRDRMKQLRTSGKTDMPSSQFMIKRINKEMKKRGMKEELDRKKFPSRKQIHKMWADKQQKKKKEMAKASHPGYDESVDKLKLKAEQSGISVKILQKVYTRGISAWNTGHRSGTTPQQWAESRVNSFLTGGKTRLIADQDLWTQVNSKHRTKEEMDTNHAFKKWLAISEGDVVIDTPQGRYVKKGSVSSEKMKAKRAFRDHKDKKAVTSRIASPIERKYLQRKDEG